MANLLLNFVAVILPSLLFQVLWLDKRSINTPKRHKSLVFVSSLMSQITCLAFSLHLVHGFTIGLENIPIILGTLYGGYGVGAALVITALLYRLLVYHQVVPVLAVFHLLTVSVAFFFIPRFHRFRKRHKVLLTLALALLSSSAVSTTVLYLSRNAKSSLAFFLLFAAIDMFTISITTLLVEMIQDQQLLMESSFKTKQYQIVGELAASVAHEIRNPLTTIRGFIQLMLEQDVPYEQRQKYLEIVLGEVDRTLVVAREYMGIAKPEVGHVEVVDSRDIILSTASVLTPYAHLRGVDIFIDELNVGLIKVDKLKLEQVLINVLKNGIEAYPDGGTVTMSNTVNTPDRSVSIIVEDHGIGMNTDQLSKIGNPFYSTKTTGTGLGLTTSYRLIQAMNGTMDIQSVEGKGTTVSIRLPLVADTSVQTVNVSNKSDEPILSAELASLQSDSDQPSLRPLL